MIQKVLKLKLKMLNSSKSFAHGSLQIYFNNKEFDNFYKFLFEPSAKILLDN